MDDLTFEVMQHSLQSASEKIGFVRNIYTRFLLLPNSVDVTLVSKESMIPEWENESHHRTMYFINHHRTSILVSEPPGYISFLDVMATVVSEVLGFPTSLPIGSLFSCPEGSETEIAACLRLCSYSLTHTGTADSSIGQEIMPQDAVQLQLHPLRPFFKGEIVAWKIQQGDKLRYGRVPEDVRPSAGQALYRLKVEMTPGETGLLLSSQVFSFRGTSIENEGPSILPEVLPAVSDNKSQETSESSRTNKTSSSQVCYISRESLDLIIYACFSPQYLYYLCDSKRQMDILFSSKYLSSCDSLILNRVLGMIDWICSL